MQQSSPNAAEKRFKRSLQQTIEFFVRLAEAENPTSTMTVQRMLITLEK